MNLYGFQLRIARVACDLTTRDVRRELGLSLTTLAKLEGMGEVAIGDGQRQAGTVEPQIVEALIRHYEARGITFLEAREPHGPGLRYTPPAKPRRTRG